MHPSRLAAPKSVFLKPWIDRLASQGKHAEHTFMDTPQRLAADEPLQALDTQSEFSQGQRSLRGEPAHAKPGKVIWRIVIGAINDPEILRSAAFDGRPSQAASVSEDEVKGLRNGLPTVTAATLPSGLAAGLENSAPAP